MSELYELSNTTLETIGCETQAIDENLQTFYYREKKS